MADSPLGFVERYSSWTGRAWLEVDGPGTTHVVDPGYGAARRSWKASWPQVPWTSDWADGTFEPTPLGRPLYPVLVGVVAGVSGAVIAAGVLGGGPAAGVVAGVSAWPLSRLFDHASVTAAGLRLGPAWAGRVRWGDVERVGVWVHGGRARLWAITRFGGGAVDVPAVLVPAVLARARRVSGLEVERGEGGNDLWYARAAALADGAPWGVLAGGLLAMGFTEEPFRTLFWAGGAAAVTGAIGAAARARGAGWGAGGVGWSTVAYALVLAALGVLRLAS